MSDGLPPTSLRDIADSRARELHVLGTAEIQSGRVLAGAELITQSLSIRPEQPAAHVSLGHALRLLHRPEEALMHFDQALRLDPRLHAALTNRGAVLMDLRRPQEAARSYERALELDPTDALTHFKRSTALVQLGNHQATAASFAQLLALAPEYPLALGGLLWSRLMLCDWSDWRETAAAIIAGVHAGKPAVIPFTLLGVTDSAQRQLQCTQAYVRTHFPAAPPLWNGEHYGHSRIRVAYLSADFGSHPVSALLINVFETHDRARFETLAISLSPAESSVFGQRVSGAFDAFIDASRMHDLAVASLIREREVDILVDLMGFTTHSRTGILAHRAAPVQVNYLGFPGTMGAPYIDYILADEFVIPDNSRAHYAEKVVWLPECFQANDRQRIQGEIAAPRRLHGLPDSGLVFCCFNNNYKLNPLCFDVWMRILHAVPAGVLWLLAGDEAAQNNLRREAARRQVDPRRLIFAGRVSYADHMARLACADLFLDTLPFNAGTTASDALWAGVPVLTCAGNAFAARMAGSLLRAAGLPELITENLTDYQSTALELASSPGRLADLRARLARNRLATPLFDSVRFRRHLESAYQSMWERSRRGEPAQSFAVPLLDT